MNPGLMVGLALFAAVLAVIYLQLADIKKARKAWSSMPTLPDYLARHPDCMTDSGIACAKCGFASIEEKGLTGEQDARRTFVCSHCGAVLYRSA